MKGIDLRKKGKKKSPQRGTQRWKYDHDSNKIISVDSQISNTYNDLVHDILVYDRSASNLQPRITGFHSKTAPAQLSAGVLFPVLLFHYSCLDSRKQNIVFLL